jgi:hypothetical protein
MKMKYIKLSVILSILTLGACTQQEKIVATDDSFVGTFFGGNPNRSCGAVWWKIVRNKEGNYTISFFRDSERKLLKFSEEGNWWIKDGHYYAIAPEHMETPDVYKVKVLSKSEIQFTSHKYDESAECKDNYKFIDRKER